MKFNYLRLGKLHAVELLPQGDSFKASLGGKSYSVGVVDQADGNLQAEIDGHPQTAVWAKEGRSIWIHWDGRSYQLEKAAGRGAGSSGQATLENVLRAPMPGQVRKVLVEEGQRVKAGETLLLLEAMKMEIRIQATQDTKVARVAVKQGQTVEKEQTLVELTADDDR